jgi:hypothetical protein
MADKIVTTQEPTHSEALLGAVENTLRSHNLRLKPGQDLAQVVDALKAEQVEVAESNGYLYATMNGSPAHVSVAVEAFATKQADRFFPRESDGITARDQMDQAAKLKMLGEEGGLARFEALPQTAPKETVVVLDKTKLTRSQWMSLDRGTRTQLSGQWGAAVVGKIIGRK